MVTLTEAAKAKLDEHFDGKDKEPVRIYLASGCSGQRLGLALDDKKETDESFDVDGYTFLVEKPLYEEAKPLKVLFDEQMGFFIESSMVFPEGGGCSSCGCGGSCH